MWLVVQADVGGSEFFQLYTLASGRLSLITDGESRNLFGAFSPDGRLIGYSSSRRNGVASDLYVVDPRDPATDRRVLEVESGGWAVLDFMPDGRRLLVMHYLAASRSVLYLVDIESGQITPITDETATIAWRMARAAPDGTVWAICDAGSDVLRLVQEGSSIPRREPSERSRRLARGRSRCSTSRATGAPLPMP